MKTIEITIDPKGEAVVQTTGFTGASCKDASRFIEQTLGEKMSEQITAEFHQPAATAQQIQQNNR